MIETPAMSGQGPEVPSSSWTQAASVRCAYDVGLHHMAVRGLLGSILSGTGGDVNLLINTMTGWTCPLTFQSAVQQGPQDIFIAFGPPADTRDVDVPVVQKDDETSVPSSSEEMVRWLYTESGLTWDQLSRVLGVSRRSVHSWASGQRVSGRNLERLSQVYSVISAVDGETPTARRYSLFRPLENEPNLFDGLVQQARKASPPRDDDGLLRRLGIAPSG